MVAIFTLAIVCNIVKTHLESKSQPYELLKRSVFNCVQYSKNTFRKQITTVLDSDGNGTKLCAI